MEWNKAPGSNHFEVVIYIVMGIAPVCLMVGGNDVIRVIDRE